MTIADRATAIWFPLLLCLGLQAMYMAAGHTPVLDGELVGPDSYMRLNRVIQLVGGGGWFDSTIPRSNAPYGEVLHWSRPFDVLLLIGAWPMALVTDFPTALFWSGALISPILQLITLAVLCWAAAPILDRRRMVYLGILFVLQPALSNYFLAGRSDHHSLILLLFVLGLGFALRLVQHRFRPGLCHAAGAVAGMALWVSVESMFALFVSVGVLGLFWVVDGGDFRRKSLHFAAALLLALSVMMLLDRPWQSLLVAEYDRLSIVHLTLAAALAGFWAAASWAEARGRFCARPAGRLALAVAGSLATAAVMWLIFPKFYSGPFVDVDPRVVPIWLSQVLEVRPLVDLDNLDLVWPLLWLGIAIPSVPFLSWMLWREHAGAAARAWIYVAVALLVFVPLSFYQVRWATYAELLLLLPYSELLWRLLERAQALRHALMQAAARAFLVVAFSFAFPILGQAVQAVQASPTGFADTSGCPITRIARYLDDAEGWGRRPRTIATLLDFGPELIYRTPHRVIATPYHRNGSGVFDTYRFMTTTDMAEARGLATTRRIELVLLCPSPVEQAHFAGDSGAQTLYRRMRTGQAPPWLRPVALPADLANSFELFEVTRYTKGP